MVRKIRMRKYFWKSKIS